MKRNFWILALLGIFLGAGINPAFMVAQEKHSVSLTAPPQVQILKVDYYLKVLKEFGGGKPALHFEVKIRNLSEKPERYSVMVSTPDGASAAGFIPAKAKKAGGLPVLDPKEEGKITLPLLTEQVAASFAVEVESVPAE